MDHSRKSTLPICDQIATIVVTYNRKELLVDCLESLLIQTHPIHAIYIVDNCSSDGTYEVLLKKKMISPVSFSKVDIVESVKTVQMNSQSNEDTKIHYVKMPENTGGAGGFYEGVKRSLLAGFDWLWLMDDDLLPGQDALEALVIKKEYLERYSKKFILNSTVLSKEYSDGDTLAFPLQELTNEGYPKPWVYYRRLSDVSNMIKNGLYKWACPFNGMFISKEVVFEVGLPNKDFYIRGDEKDYLWRVAKKFDFYTVINSIAYHPIPPNDEFDWKQYYHIRNMMVIHKYFNYRLLRNSKLIISSVFNGLLNGKDGLRIVFHAIHDGLRGRLGKKNDL